MSPRRPFPPIGCVYFILCWIYKRKKCWGKSNILLKMSNFWRTLLIPYKETGLLSPKIESWTTGLLLNNGFKNRTCHVEGFLRFSRIVAYKCSPSLESLRGLLTGKKKKRSQGPTIKLLKQNLWQFGPISLVNLKFSQVWKPQQESRIWTLNIALALKILVPVIITLFY